MKLSCNFKHRKGHTMQVCGHDLGKIEIIHSSGPMMNGHKHSNHNNGIILVNYAQWCQLAPSETKIMVAHLEGTHIVMLREPLHSLKECHPLCRAY